MSIVISHPDVEGTAVIPEHTLSAYARKGWVIADRTDEPAPNTAARPMKEPNRSASAAEWKTYAVVSGMDYATAMSKTRDELVEHYDPKPAPKAPKSGTPAPTTQES